MITRRVALLTLALAAASCGRPREAAAQPPPAGPTETAVLSHTVTNIQGEPVKLSSYAGKVLLIVNTASECGFTPQYAPLQTLRERFQARGFEVLAFPSNDFGGQEPGSSKEIQEFCSTRYKVTFPLFAKVHAKGPEIAPLYRTLTEATREGIRGEVRWNFTKFLVNRKGEVIARFEPVVDPLNEGLVSAVEKALAEPAPK